MNDDKRPILGISIGDASVELVSGTSGQPSIHDLPTPEVWPVMYAIDDDGRVSLNPDPAIHPNGSIFDLTNLFRGGDTVNNVTGALDYDFGQYKVQPTQGADYNPDNLRPVQPDDVGGNLKVASFNVLNYFTTIDVKHDSRTRNRIMFKYRSLQGPVG